jgi:hypothetical protein
MSVRELIREAEHAARRLESANILIPALQRVRDHMAKWARGLSHIEHEDAFAEAGACAWCLLTIEENGGPMCGEKSCRRCVKCCYCAKKKEWEELASYTDEVKPEGADVLAKKTAVGGKRKGGKSAPRSSKRRKSQSDKPPAAAAAAAADS